MVSSNDLADVDQNSKNTELTGVERKQFWCNFCNFDSADLQDYLSHSCRAVLAARGESVPDSSRVECR
jgi:hypothetical protein